MEGVLGELRGKMEDLGREVGGLQGEVGTLRGQMEGKLREVVDEGQRQTAAMNVVVSGLLASGRFVRVAPQFAPSAWRPFLGLCAPFAVANILNYVYLRSDQILLGEWSVDGSEAVA